REDAAGVRLLDGTVIEASWVVLCAGTYGSPALLLRSGIGPADELRSIGVPVRVDLPGVGANLADHPAIDADCGYRGPGSPHGPLHLMASFHSTSSALHGPPDLLLWVSDPEGPPGEAASLEITVVLTKPRSRGAVRLRSRDPADPPSII